MMILCVAPTFLVYEPGDELMLRLGKLSSTNPVVKRMELLYVTHSTIYQGLKLRNGTMTEMSALSPLRATSETWKQLDIVYLHW